MKPPQPSRVVAIPVDVRGWVQWQPLDILLSTDIDAEFTVTQKRDGATIASSTVNEKGGRGDLQCPWMYSEPKDTWTFTVDPDLAFDITRMKCDGFVIAESTATSRPVLVETIWLDSKVGTVTSTATLEDGQAYTLRVTGNFRVNPEAEVDEGTPDTILYPSPGETDDAKPTTTPRFTTPTRTRGCTSRGVVAHGAAHDGTRTNVYHAAYDPSDGHMYTADGTDLGTVLTWAEHPDCLAATATDTNVAVPTTFASDDIWIAWAEVADQSLQVTRWDGTSWTTVDTGITLSSEWGVTDGGPLAGRGRGPRTRRHGRRAAPVPDRGRRGDVVRRRGGRRRHREQHLARGRSRAVPRPAEQSTSPVTIYALPATPVLADHTHTDLAVSATDVRDAGRWEVLLDDAEQPVSTGASDWLYVWVGGT